ncbi:MAG: acyloxyacyl hydrolase [Balneolaceae bacterium]|nr:acyloxyacyl hydrolase [Balneolaceae bacterium]MBO6546272.1 acyloxyacyl hydrolase [Balneolaceae bacterium]MBO6648631.1 acyloxyacyl hydrolase [Balneolaceae bacterium]
MGKTPDSQTFALQFNYGWRSKLYLKSTPISYLVNFTPYINYNYPKRDEGSKRDVVIGLGFSPLGFEIQKKLNNKIGLVLNTSGGFILIDKTFPTDKGRRMNYTFSLSPGLIFQTNQTLFFLLGYKFHHISNAQTGSENPGIDSNFIFFSTQLTL